ncbi:hypothetical protein ACWQG8_002534 [Klebsiella pneumoniae]
MTDITELAQSLKAAAEKAADNFDPNMFVQTRNILALVEALEKAQAENTAGVAGMAESYETTISMLRSRIAELESSTVKLPEVRITIAEAKLRNLTPQQHDAYNAGASRAVAKICQELTAAGIKVEAE